MTCFPSLLAWLATPGVLGAAAPQRIDTHAAVVFLTETHAWKLKRPVHYDYLDFSTPELRRRMLQRELELNQPVAPSIYLGLWAVTCDAQGQFALTEYNPNQAEGEAELEVVDWLLCMRRFSDDALLSRRVEQGSFRVRDAAQLGAMVARLHQQLPATQVVDGAAHMSAVIDPLLAGLRRQLEGGEVVGLARSVDAEVPEAQRGALAQAVASLASGLQHWLTEHAALLRARASAGWVRRCHGDLHLGNLVWLDDGPVAFDALEFDETLATIDVWYDLAFLLMDLLHQNKRQEAGVVRDRYLLTLDCNDAWQGLALLPGFMAVRCAVRAMVSLQKVQQLERPDARFEAWHEAARYVKLALALLQPVKPSLWAVGGLSGSGKSTVAAALAPHLLPLPAAVHLRTDLIRKQRWGCAETDPLPAVAYTPAASQAVYEALWHEAELALQAGCSVVLDGVHLQPGERERSAAVAAACGVSFHGLWLEAPLATLQARVSARQNDASDATAAVVQQQAACNPGAIVWQGTSSAEVLAEPQRFIP